ncbi:Ankyrin repeat [Halarsenatibacter silvermanii]|uniref:Ankyrin repeat n=2 Tax=Halarsenatibacter silvermanii TaxID=321763 RepID=A0A1G9MZA8_9FIRM|nr:Ankyrin repeat [Halarsenatibacter silvermanii]
MRKQDRAQKEKGGGEETMIKKAAIFMLIFGFIFAMTALTAVVEAESNLLELVKEETPEKIEEALKDGADVNQTDDRGKTPLIVAAAHNSRPEVIDLLLDYGARMERRDKNGQTALYHAARHNPSPEVMRKIIWRGAAVNVTSDAGYTPLLRAAELGAENKVEILISRGAEIDRRGPKGETALMLLMENDPSPEIVQRLLNAGASPRLSDDQGRTALHRAAAREQTDNARMLIEAEASPDPGDREGITPLMRAAANNERTEMISLLLAEGAELESRSRTGKTPLMKTAAENESVRVMEYLLAEGAEVNTSDEEGRSVLHHLITGPAARRKLAVLIEKSDPELNAADREGNTPLHLAVDRKASDYELIEKLLQAGADPNILDGRGYSPLMMLAESSDRPELFELMLRAGAEPDKTGYRDKTALMLAAENTSSQEVIFALLEAGAEVPRQDARGRKVVDYLEGNEALFNTEAYWELQYMEPEERELEPMEFKSRSSATLRGLALPSLGHAYADSWWPKGALFLTGEAASLGMALTRDDSSDALPFYLAFAALKAWEIYDVNQEVGEHNREAEEYNERVEEFHQQFQE